VHLCGLLLCILILVLPPVIFNMDLKVEVLLEDNVTLTCNAIGDNIKYEWKTRSGSLLYGNRISGVYNDTLVITGVRSYDDNTYTCVANDKGGNVTSSVTLIVTGMIFY